MIEECDKAGRKLMIAYRSQYEPMDRAIVKMVRGNRCGRTQGIVSVNSQNVGDPGQWRLKHELAGGGPLVDMGIYSINAARFLTGEEPFEVSGSPTGGRAILVSRSRGVGALHPALSDRHDGHLRGRVFSTHRSQFLRLHGSDAWAELNPAFAYRGLQMRVGRVTNGQEILEDLRIEPGNQFAREIDHMSQCVRSKCCRTPPARKACRIAHHRGHLRIGAHWSRVKLPIPSGTRGPDPGEDA